MRKIILLITAVIMVAQLIFSAEIRYETNYDRIAQFLGIEIGARAAGMGNARVALAEGAEAVFLNPANGKTRYYYNSFLISHNSWIQGMFQETVSFVKDTNSEWGIFGIGISYLNEGTIKKYEMDGSGNGVYIGDITPYAMVIKLNWAAQMIKSLFFGVNLGYMREDIDGYVIQKGLVDVGFTYTGIKDINLALVRRNFGRTIDGHGIFTDAILAIGYKLNLVKFGEINAEVDLRAFTFERFGVGLGIEYIYNKIIAIRAGYENDYTGVAGLKGLRLGMGIRYEKFLLDFAFEPYGELGQAYKVSFGVNF
ncbi:MAG: PorV/PorQ family protein [Candidatus Goldbacteria bacterium]|nr:PorV/PorQ family protein [Candidatus Goldiibacteriota bacterium]